MDLVSGTKIKNGSLGVVRTGVSNISRGLLWTDNDEIESSVNWGDVGILSWDSYSDFGSEECVEPDESFLLVVILLSLTSWLSLTVLILNPVLAIKVLNDDTINESLVAALVRSLLENHLGNLVKLSLWEIGGNPEVLSECFFSVVETGLGSKSCVSLTSPSLTPHGALNSGGFKVNDGLLTVLDFQHLRSWIVSNEVDSSSAASVVSTFGWEVDSNFGGNEWLNLDDSPLLSGVRLKLTGLEKSTSFVVLPLLTVEVLNSDFTNDSFFEFSTDLVEVTSSLKNNLFDCLRCWKFDHGPVVKVVGSDVLSRHGETGLRVQFHLSPLFGPEGFEGVLGFHLFDGLGFLHATHLKFHS